MSGLWFIEAETDHHRVFIMCRLLEVSASRAFGVAAPSVVTPPLSDVWLLHLIPQIHQDNPGLLWRARKRTLTCDTRPRRPRTPHRRQSVT